MENQAKLKSTLII